MTVKDLGLICWKKVIMIILDKKNIQKNNFRIFEFFKRDRMNIKQSYLLYSTIHIFFR